MKSNVLVIMKKEFARFFGDRRMVFTSLIMPGLLLYVLYTFMGSAISNIVQGGDNTPAFALNMPEDIASFAEMPQLGLSPAVPGDVESIKDGIRDGQYGLLAVFPENFTGLVASGQIPDVFLFYNSSSQVSLTLYQTMSGLLDQYRIAIDPKFTVNSDEDAGDLAPPGAASASDNILASMLPMLMMLFFFASCISLAPESIAGEKERGTIATLLVTPVKAWVLAAGKILSLAVIALLCGLASSAGAILGMGQMITQQSGQSFSLQLGGAQEFILMAALVLSTSFLFIALLSIISANAKSVKEANTTSLPLLVISAVVGFMPMVGVGADGGALTYAIPLYNSVKCLGELFSGDYSTINVIIAAASNFLYAVAGAIILARMFQSERIIMTK